MKLIFGGLGRRGAEAIAATIILAVTIATVAASLMVVEGATMALARAERQDRPDTIQVKSRFNRALFETPRSGNLPPLTIPVYEPLIDRDTLKAAVGDSNILMRQSLLRNVVSGDGFLNLYIFGIDPAAEVDVSSFSLLGGRFLRRDDGTVAVIDRASASALGVDLGGTFPVRKADGKDLQLTVVGILDNVELRGAPPRTAEAPSLRPSAATVSSGVFVTLQTSGEIFGRPTLTDALVVARSASAVPKLVDAIQEAFRLEPGVFVAERYGQYQRKVRDFEATLAFFATIALATAVLAGSFAASLLNDIHIDRHRQYAALMALGFSPLRGLTPGIVLGLVIAAIAAVIGGVAAAFLVPRSFAMPSLMADLGAIVPKLDLVVAGSIAVLAIAATAAGLAATGFRLLRYPLATALSRE